MASPSSIERSDQQQQPGLSCYHPSLPRPLPLQQYHHRHRHGHGHGHGHGNRRQQQEQQKQHQQRIPTFPPEQANIEPSFICTICSQPQYPPISPPSSSNTISGPKLLGTSAIIACQFCWRTILDLSVCWVCGEHIVPGTEVVSLGWCFWHRQCFGCLICGKEIASLPRSREDGFARQHEWRSGRAFGSHDGIGVSKKRKRSRKRCMGVELEEVPLCEACKVETGGDGCRDAVSRKGLDGGLDTVSRFGGGVRENHLEKFAEQPTELESLPRRLARRLRRVKGATGIESELGRFINRSSTTSHYPCDPLLVEDRIPLLWQAADPGMAEDGACDRRSGEQDCKFTVSDNPSLEEFSPVYVTGFNSSGDPPFAPRPTKCLPLWMSLLPANVEKARKMLKRQQQKEDPNPRLSQEFTTEYHKNQTASSGSSSTDSSESCDGFVLLDNLTSLGATGSKTRSGEAKEPIKIPRPRRRAETSISFNEDELNTHPRPSRRSQPMEADVPPEFPRKPPRERRSLTPFPQTASPASDCEGSSSSLMQSICTGSGVAHSEDNVSDMPTLPRIQELGSFSTTPKIERQIVGSSTVSAQQPGAFSAEYLDRYHPHSPASANQYWKHVAKEQPELINKKKKPKVQQVSEKRNTTQAPSVQGPPSSGFNAGGGEVANAEAADLDLKRAHLRNELMLLFCEVADP